MKAFCTNLDGMSLERACAERERKIASLILVGMRAGAFSGCNGLAYSFLTSSLEYTDQNQVSSIFAKGS